MRASQVLRALGTVGFLALCAPGISHAIPPDKAKCLQGYDGGQTARTAGRLRDARADFATCDSATCPAEMRQECSAWLAEVDAELPTVVFRVVLPDGTRAADATLRVDGEITRAEEGTPIPLDPGDHTLRVERPGSAPLTQVVRLLKGEKQRAIELRLAPAAPPPASASASVSAVPPLETRSAWPGWTLGAVGVIGLASFGYFGLTGVSRYHDLKSSCAPRCPDSDTSSVERRFLVADISLGVGVLAVAGAAYWFLTRPAGAPVAKVGWDVTLAPSAVRGGVVVRF